MPTVLQIKTMYQALLAPGDNARMLRLINEADIRLLEFGRWNWTRAKISMTPYVESDMKFVSLPVAYTAILGARLGSYAQMVRGEEFEFAPDGNGEVKITGCRSGSGLIDQGYQTKNFGSGVETRRVYKVTGKFEPTDGVTALVRKAPVTVVADGNSTVCPDFAALKLMMYAINFEEENDIERSRSYISDALRALDNKEKSFRAGAKQNITVKPYGPGISGIPRIR